MKKRYIMIISAFVIMTGCSAGTETVSIADNNEIHEEVKESDSTVQETAIVEEIISDAEIMGNPSDSEEIYANSDAVAIASVKKIEGYSNVNEETGEYCYPYTYGILEITEVLKGDIPEQTVEFVRMGGIISWENYYASLHEAQKEKRNQQSEKTPDYVDCHFEDDISIEEGKTYLMYFAVEDGEFVIHGWQGGLREYRDGTVLNNYTGEWQKLEDVIPR